MSGKGGTLTVKSVLGVHSITWTTKLRVVMMMMQENKGGIEQFNQPSSSRGVAVFRILYYSWDARKVSTTQRRRMLLLNNPCLFVVYAETLTGSSRPQHINGLQKYPCMTGGVLPITWCHLFGPYPCRSSHGSTDCCLSTQKSQLFLPLS